MDYTGFCFVVSLAPLLPQWALPLKSTLSH